ncbi:hypothetical protein ABIE91_001756 [Bradyrhizobium elkanii]
MLRPGRSITWTPAFKPQISRLPREGRAIVPCSQPYWKMLSGRRVCSCRFLLPHRQRRNLGSRRRPSPGCRRPASRPRIVLARVQRVKVEVAIHAADDPLAVDHELLLLVFQRGRDDPWAALSNQLGPISVALEARAIAIILDLWIHWGPPNGLPDRGRQTPTWSYHGDGKSGPVWQIQTKRLQQPLEALGAIAEAAWPVPRSRDWSI